jgi:hypothetical protein
MKPNHIGRRCAFIGLTILALFAGHANAGERESFVVDGEHFTLRQITDSNLNNVVAFRFSAPKGWRDSGQIYWDLLDIKTPMSMSASIENPANAEACFVFPALICAYLPGPRAPMREGKRGLDGLNMRPLQPVQALEWYIRQNRGDVSDLKFIGSRDLPDLPKAFKVSMAQNQKGIGEKITYTSKGKPVEEEFYAVFYYQVVQGETLWGLCCIHSFRAPTGGIEKRRNVLAAIPKSFLITPEFTQRVMAVKQRLSANYQAVMRADAQEVANARARSAQLTASENQFLAGVDRNLAASQTAQAGSSGSGGGGSTRTANDGYDDYIRGVATMNDPDTGTSQHSIMEQYHWTDGYGNYRNSNDQSYDPNHTENGNWQLMTPAQ